jgi:heme iron utilization protein
LWQVYIVMSEQEKALSEYQSFLALFKSVIIATVNPEGCPHSSYAPFVVDASKNFYILISDLAAHASHLKATGKASLLLIEDENNTQSIFSRRRLTFDCSATLIDRNTQEWNKIADNFQQRFGNIIETLRNLSDFNIFQLTPKEGNFVIGFGGAYKVSGEDLNTLIPARPRT